MTVTELIKRSKAMKTQGGKVIAIRDITDGKISSYGEGVLVTRQVPDAPMFAEHKIKNPCILLDTGKYIWGFQCYWSEAEKIEAMIAREYAGYTVELVEVENEVKPLQQ